MLNIAVCDDEPYMLRQLSDRIAEYMDSRTAQPYQISGFSGGTALLESGCGFDLIFLDIQMAPPDGMETAGELRRRGAEGLLVFVTVLQECVFKAFEVSAFDYLLKPLDGVRFQQTMDRALRTLERRNSRCVMVRKGSACQVLLRMRIVYCEVLGRKLYIHLRDGTTVDCYGRLEELERQLGGGFFRCHRSYLVNLDDICGCGGGEVSLFQGGRIPVSRLRQRELSQALLRHMKEREL